MGARFPAKSSVGLSRLSKRVAFAADGGLNTGFAEAQRVTNRDVLGVAVTAGDRQSNHWLASRNIFESCNWANCFFSDGRLLRISEFCEIRNIAPSHEGLLSFFPGIGSPERLLIRRVH